MGTASIRGSKFCVCVCVCVCFKVKCQIVPIRYYHLCKKVENIKNFLHIRFCKKVMWLWAEGIRVVARFL